MLIWYQNSHFLTSYHYRRLCSPICKILSNLESQVYTWKVFWKNPVLKLAFGQMVSAFLCQLLSSWSEKGSTSSFEISLILRLCLPSTHIIWQIFFQNSKQICSQKLFAVRLLELKWYCFQTAPLYQWKIKFIYHSFFTGKYVKPTPS